MASGVVGRVGADLEGCFAARVAKEVAVATVDI